jgi:hypothetical protein
MTWSKRNNFNENRLFGRDRNERPVGGTCSDGVRELGLARHGSNDDAVGIYTHEEQGVQVNNVNGEIECTCRSCLRIDGEVVGLRPVTVEGEAAAYGNIEKLLAGHEFVEIHQAAEAARGRQSELANKVFYAGAEAAPAEDVVSGQRRCGNRTGRLRGKRAVADDLGVGLLKDGLRWRNQIEDERKGSRLRVRPGERSATKLIRIHGVSTGYRPVWQQGYDTVVVFVDHDICDVAGAVRGETPRRGDGPAGTRAGDQKCKAATQRGNIEGNVLLREGISYKRGGKTGSNELHAGRVHNVECKIPPGDVCRAAPKCAAVAVCVDLIERPGKETLLPGECACNVGIEQTVADVAVAVRIEAAHDGRRINSGAGDVHTFEFKDVAPSDRRIDERRGVLPLKRTAGRGVHVGLRDEALSGSGKRDAVVRGAGVVRQANAASAVRADRILAARERQRLNPRAYIDVLKPPGNVALAVCSKSTGAAKKTTLPRAQFCAGHGEGILSG